MKVCVLCVVFANSIIGIIMSWCTGGAGCAAAAPPYEYDMVIVRVTMLRSE